MKYIPSCPPTCPYPNLYFEYILQILGSHDTYASHANVTTDVFENVLNGVGCLTTSEKNCFYNSYSPRIYAPIKYNYLFSPHISFYDMKNKKHLHKFQYLYNRYYQALYKAAPNNGFWRYISYNFCELDELIENRFVARAFYNYVLRLIDYLDRHYRLKTQQPRKTIVSQ